MRLSKAVAEGNLYRIGRGLYRRNDDFSEYEHFVAALNRRPQGVICLLSALQFHGITTQMPQQVWIALPPEVSRPRNSSVRVTVLRGVNYEYGREVAVISGEKIYVYSVAKSIVDAFRFRNKIGLNVAMESLRMALEQKKVSVDAIVKAAMACRALKTITPYLESYYV